jgi:hypothetical protein
MNQEGWNNRDMRLAQWCTNPGRQVAVAIKFCSGAEYLRVLCMEPASCQPSDT